MTTHAPEHMVQGPADPERAVEELQQFDRDVQFLASEHESLLRDHPGKWAAIFNGSVVGVADTPEQLSELLREAGVARSRAVMEYLEPDVIAAY